MAFISDWARSNKTSIPQRMVVERMKVEGVKDFTTINALAGLVKKGYIRRGCEISNKTSYVQLRSI